MVAVLNLHYGVACHFSMHAGLQSKKCSLLCVLHLKTKFENFWVSLKDMLTCSILTSHCCNYLHIASGLPRVLAVIITLPPYRSQIGNSVPVTSFAH